MLQNYVPYFLTENNLQYGPFSAYENVIRLDILCAEKMIMLPKSLFNGIRNEVDAEIAQVKLGCPQSPTKVLPPPPGTKSDT